MSTHTTRLTVPTTSRLLSGSQSSQTLIISRTALLVFLNNQATDMGIYLNCRVISLSMESILGDPLTN